MPWLGVRDSVDENEFVKFIEDKLGLKVLKTQKVKVKTRRGWLSFIIVDVLGFVEGYARYVVENFKTEALEGGEHLILGEPSAKLWDEAVKIIFPDGTEEIIPIYTFDGFLDIRLPTDKVEGLRGYITVGGLSYSLPLSFEDLVEIYQQGKIEKIEKAVSIYGLKRVLSEDAILKLSQLKKKRAKVEIDYEGGFVFIVKEHEIITKSIPDYVIELVRNKEYERAMEIYSKCTAEIREETKRKIVEFCRMLEEIGKKDQVKELMDFLKNKISHAENQKENLDNQEER